MKLHSLLGIVALLTGCATEQPANQAQLQTLGNQCQAYGFKPGSDAFAACIYQLDQQRIAGNQQRRMAVGAALGNMGSQMQANAAANPYRPPVRCTSTPGMNGVVRTSCY